MATGAETHLESDGKGVQVMLSYTVAGEQVAYVEGLLGVTGKSGDSGDYISLTIDRREYQFSVPAALSVSKGNTVYVDVDGLAEHAPEDADYNTDGSGTTPIKLFLATSDKDANNVVTGILLSGM